MIDSEHMLLQRLREAFDTDNFSGLEWNHFVTKDIHCVSSVLKLYFRSLPVPVCTFHLYDQFVSAIQSVTQEEERVRSLKEVLHCLPSPNYRVLEALAKHLHRVAQHHQDTGMTARNLAIVWAPNLLR